MTGRIELLAADPDLAAGLPPDELPLASRLLVADARPLPPGPWEPAAACGDGFALLVLRGIATREIWLAGRRCAELFGPGDVVYPPRAQSESLLPHEVTWTVTEPGTVAILNGRFSAAARRWPSLGVALNARLVGQAERIALHVAIAQLARVDQRLLALFWHLADRWGRVTPEGVTVPLALTHEALGRLVGAQRPTVTLALADLAAAGTVTRPAPDAWVLRRDSRALLEPVRRTLAAAG